MDESEEIFFTRLTRKKEIAQDCPIAKKREKAFKKRKVILNMSHLLGEMTKLFS